MKPAVLFIYLLPLTLSFQGSTGLAGGSIAQDSQARNSSRPSATQIADSGSTGIPNTPPRPEGDELPEPPSQHRPWKVPESKLPTNLTTSVQVLFDLGLADPRGCDYRQFEVVVGSVWGGTGKIKTHGWVMPSRAGSSERFAVSWAGTVCPVAKVGAKADLQEDIEALLRADEIWRKETADQSFAFRGPPGVRPENFSISETNMTIIKVALLLRLGEGKLAQKYWDSWRALKPIGQTQENANDPFLTLAFEWTWSLFDRAICAHMRGDDALALADCRQLNVVWPKLETEAKKRGFPDVFDSFQARLAYFSFLEPLPLLLADQQRRAKERLHRPLSKASDTPERIHKLIAGLDEVAEHQWGQPGGVWLGGNATVKALVSEGEDAIEPLLDCMETDKRLTRSVSFHRDFSTHRKVLSVRDAAEAALRDLLKVHFETASQYRAYWQKYRAVQPPAERWYRTLLDDEAGQRQWMQAARNILSREKDHVTYLWGYAPKPNATNGFAYAGEPVRVKTGPSVAELLSKRALEIAPKSFISSQDCWTFEDAADLGLMLAEWDKDIAAHELGKIINCCPALYADPKEWTSGCAVVPDRFAQLAVAMAEVGDTAGLDVYAKWIGDRKLQDLEDALSHALSPMGRFPNHPSIREVSARLFQPAKGDWLNLHRGCDLLGTRLVLNESFLKLVRQALQDKNQRGTIVLMQDGHFDIQMSDSYQGGMLKLDPAAPKTGERISFRVCDDVAHRLSRIEALPHLELYWPEAKRDETLAAIIEFLNKNSHGLKLNAARWPLEEEE